MATAAAASTVMLASIKYRKLFMSVRVFVCVGYLQNDHGHDYTFFSSSSFSFAFIVRKPIGNVHVHFQNNNRTERNQKERKKIYFIFTNANKL